MEQVMDKIISEIEELKATDEFVQVMDIQTDVKFEDPGLVVVAEYPYIFVSPLSESPVSDTLGRAGYDVRRLEIAIGIVINAADYFDYTVSEAAGVRQLVQSSTLLRERLRRLSKRNLDGLAGVRNVVVLSTSYVPDLRDQTFVRVAVTNISVERQYQHEE